MPVLANPWPILHVICLWMRVIKERLSLIPGGLPIGTAINMKTRALQEWTIQGPWTKHLCCFYFTKYSVCKFINLPGSATPKVRLMRLTGIIVAHSLLVVQMGVVRPPRASVQQGLKDHGDGVSRLGETHYTDRISVEPNPKIDALVLIYELFETRASKSRIN